ncbi:MAG: hypothetical protein JNG84_04405 [Archangium sp.]|nr:hypothetical protein [Archangium sp.]
MRLATRAVYYALLPVFWPMHAAMQRALKKSVAAAKAAPRVEQMLARDPTTGGVPSPKYVDPPVELDYLEHRSSAYVGALVLDSAWQAARAITGDNAADEPSNADFARDMVGSICAFLISRDEANGTWVLNTETMHTDTWWNADRFEVTRFVFEPARDVYELHDVHGRVHRPADPTWLGARRKLIAQLSLWAPIRGHTWAHFWLPDVIAATVHQSMRRDTNLYRLLAPHTRFANRHNHAGLWIQRASDNEPSFGKKLVPWLAIPLRKLDLRHTLTTLAERYHRAGDHHALPERLDRRIPYFAMLGAYFDATQAFVDSLMPELEGDAFAEWARAVEAWYPGYEKVPMARAVAMIIWHMGIAHGADHLTYCSWARRYGTCEVEPTIEALSTAKPSAYARYRFLAFLNNFADFRPPPTGLDLRMTTSDQAYGFAPGSRAESLAKSYMQALRDVDGRLRAEGNQVVEVDQLIRAICF